MKQKILLIGAYHEMLELCELCGYEVIGIIDNEVENNYYGTPIVGKDSDAKALFKQYRDTHVVITPYLPNIREKLYKLYSSIGYKFATIVSPYARVSKYASIGEGTVVQSGVNIAANTHIGRFVKLNTNCNIMHDNEVGDFSTISPNAVSLGYVKISNNSFLGANCTILPNVFLGTNCIIGAGAVVTHNVMPNQTVKGVPAK